MSTTVTISGSSYSVPALADENWGDNVSNLLIALATSTKVLQNTGGSFPLTAEIDFGASYGLKSIYFKSRTSNSASAGQLRLANADSIKFRNNANDGDLALSLSTDTLQFNSIDLADVSTAQTLSNKTHTSPVINTSVSGTAILDEDDMASDSATQLATQQSIKAYVDAQVATKNEADEIAYSNATSGLSATDVQAAIDEVEARVDTAEVHAANTSNPHSVTKAQVGLTNVDDTSDATKNAATATLTNKTIVAPIIDDSLVLVEEASSPSTPSSGYKKLYAKNDGKIYTLDSSANEIEVGSGGGSGGKNYIDNNDFESNTDGVTTFNEVTYTDGDGGTVDGISVSKNTTTPLSGTGDLKITKAATDSSGDGITITSTAIDRSDRGRNLYISFEWDGTDANYIDGDLVLKVYSTGTDATTLPVVPLSGLNSDGTLPALKTKILAYVPTSLNTDSTVRISLHLPSDSDSGSSWNVYLDDAELTPSKQVIFSNDGPIGEIIAHSSETVPDNFLYCDGSAVSRTTYADLFAAIGVSFGYGNNSTTFNVPDLRGRFLRGQDDGSSRDPDDTSRTAMNTGGNTGDNIGSVQDDQMGDHNHQIYDYTNGSTTASGYNSAGTSNTLSAGTRTSGTQLAGTDGSTATNIAEDLWTSNVSEGEGTSESRPKNANVRYYIRYRQNSNVVSTTEIGLQTSKARMALVGSNQTISTVNQTTIQLDTEDYTEGNGLTVNTGSYRIDINRTGYYLIQAQVRMGGVTDGEQMRVFINNSSGAIAEGFNSGSSGTGVGIGVSVIKKLTAGDYVYIDVDSTADASYTVTASAGGYSTYLEMIALPDFSIYGAYQEKNKVQTKTLSSQVSSTGVISDLSFANLVVGKWYEIKGLLYWLDNGTNLTDLQVFVDVYNGATNITDFGERIQGSALDIDAAFRKSNFNFIFQATNSALTFNLSALTGATVEGSSTTTQTHVQLIERNDLIETDEF